MADITKITHEMLPPERARLPALPAPEVSVDFQSRVKEIVEVLAGSRGSQWDRAVTFRDLHGAGLVELREGDSRGLPEGPLRVASAPQGMAEMIEQALRESPAYRHLQTRIGSIEAIATFPEEIREQLAVALDDLARQRQADSRTVERTMQTAQISLSSRLQEVTAALDRNAAGVREFSAAYADEIQAVATKITQLEASIGGDGSGVSIEERLTAVASEVDGLQGQWAIKIQTNDPANPVIAGIALAVEDPIAGPGTSSLTFLAEKFAFVTGNGKLFPFTLSGNDITLNGNVRINGTLTVGGLPVAIGNAQSAADAAKAAADAANAKADAIAADGVLDRGEKSQLVTEWAAEDLVLVQIQSQAASLGVSATAYIDAHNAAAQYLVSLSPAWNDTTQNTNIDRTAYRNVFKSLYEQRFALINAIAAKAATLAQWSGVAGPDRPADGATNDTKLFASAGITLEGNTATMISGTGWSQQVISADGYTGGAFASVVAGVGTCLFGLNTDPNANTSFDSIDHGLYMEAGGVLYRWLNGASAGQVGTWAAGDVLSIIHDGSKLVFQKSGTSLATVTETSLNAKYYFDSSFLTVGSKFSGIRFGPMTSNAYVGSTPAADVSQAVQDLTSPFSVSISGTLASSVSGTAGAKSYGTLTANITGGVAPVTYTWECVLNWTDSTTGASVQLSQATGTSTGVTGTAPNGKSTSYTITLTATDKTRTKVVTYGYSTLHGTAA